MAAAAPALVALIGMVLPRLVIVAAAIATAAVVLGLDQELKEKLQDVVSGNLLEKLRALGYLPRLIHRIIFSDAYLEETHTNEAGQTYVSRMAGQTFDQLRRELMPAITFPTFDTILEVQQWLDSFDDAFQMRLYSDAEVAAIESHANSEFTRLREAAAAEAVTSTFPADLTTEQEEAVAAEEQAAAEAAAKAAAAAAAAIPGLAGAGAIGAGLAAIIPLLSTLSIAATQIGSAIRGQHRSRQLCVDTTATTLLNALGGVAATVGIPAFLLTSDKGRAIVDQVIGVAWDLVFREDLVPKPADPDRALEAARTLFAEKAALGAAAHLLAVAAEANANIKNMGVGYLAAFLSDLAGFQRVANATMGEVETAALAIPMRQKVNRDYRPNLPSLNELTDAYAKKEIPPGPIPPGYPPAAGYSEPDEGAPTANLYEALSRYGIRDEWIRVYSHHLFRDPRMFELVRIGQFFNPQLDPRSSGSTPFMTAWIDARPWLLEQIGITREEWDEAPWFYFKANAAGYEPADVRVIVETAQRAVVRREQTLMLDAVTRLYRDGFITDERLKELTEEAWGLAPGPDGELTFRGDPVRARVRATQVRTLYEVLSSRQEIALRGFSRGLLTEQEVVEHLAALGMPQERILEALRREKMGLVPRTRLAVAATVEFSPNTGDEEADGA